MRKLAICVLAGFAVARAQIAVDESATRARLVDGETRVYLALNSGFPGIVPVRVQLAWLDVNGGERHRVERPYDAPPGKSVVEARMGFDDRDDALLCRLRYSVNPGAANLTAFSPQRGVLSFPNIADHAFVLSGVGIGAKPRAGKSYQLRIFASHPVTNRPMAGVVVRADEASATATTDANGAAVLQFMPDPEDWDTPDTITVEGRLGDLKRTAEVWHPAVAGGSVRIYTDKPLYQPGQTAHVRILAIGDDRRARAKSVYRIRIQDENSTVAQATRATTSRFGIAHTDWEIASNAAAGKYRIEVEGDDDSEPVRREIEVRRYELPSFRVSVQPDRPYYLGGQQPAIEVRADYLFGKPVAEGTVKVAAADDGQSVLCEGRLDAHGRFHSALKIERRGEDSGDSRFTDLHYTAYVADATTNRTEQRQFDIRISRDPVHLYVVREEVTTMGLRLYAATYMPDGQPANADEEVTLHGRVLATTRTNRFGLARLDLPAEDDLVVRARISEGSATQELGSWPTSPRPAVRLTTDHALYRPGQPIRCSISSTSKDLSGALLAWREDGRVLFSRAVQLRDGKAEAEIAGAGFTAEITVGFLSGLGPEYSAARPVLYPGGEELRVTAKAGSAQYRPGERAALNFMATDGKGAPVEAALGIAVVDQSVFERVAADQAGVRRRWFSEEEQETRVGGVSLEDLKNLPPSKIDADYDLVAEALLEPNLIDRRDESFLDEQSSAYAKMSREGLSEVIERLEDEYDRTLSYPRDAGAVRKIAGPAFTSAVDPWLQPYRVEFGIEGPSEQLRFLSAGPDKKFGTPDDIVALTVAREWFLPYKALIGLALRPLQDYPATASELAALLDKNGVRLAVLRDPWQTALRAPITHRYGKRIVEIQSAGPDRKFGTADDFTVASFEGTFFNVMQAKIDAALASATKFPADEGQFRSALKTAGLDLDALRDPWGRRYELVFGADTEFGNRYRFYTYQEYQGTPEQRIEPVPTKSTLHTIGIRSAGEDGIRNTYDDFTVATFSRVISEEAASEKPAGRSPSGPPSASIGGRGAISGVISDPAGGRIANAEAILAELYRTKADENGRYSFYGVPAGTYTLRFESTGFQTAFYSGVPVRAGHMTALDVMLRVGAATETVTVTAELPLVQTSALHMAQVQPGVAAAYTPRVRDYFPETLLWNPELVTDRLGRARLDFKLADSITTWRVAVIGSTVDGRIAETGVAVKAFEPFFAELDPPQVLTAGDVIELPVPIRNYLETDQSVSVEAAAPPSLEISGPAKQVRRVAASSSADGVLKLRAASAASAAPLRVTARGGNAADAIEKLIAIHPDGQPVTRSDSDIVANDRKLHVEIPADAIAGSVQAEVVLYPSLMAHAIESMEALLKRPYGCGEQTISSTYPNLLFLRMAKRAGFHDARLESRARRNLQSGYQRLLGYRTSEGGFAYWHGKPADVALTAYAIAFLEDAREIIEIDDGVVGEARAWLRRESPADAAAKGLALGVLARGGEQYEHDVVPRLGELARSASTEDPYAIAALALAALDAKKADLAQPAIARLRGLAQEDRGAICWRPAAPTPYYGWGRAGTIETTALAITALARWRKQAAADPELDRLIDRGVLFLLRSKDAYGTWLSTQATVRVFGALLEALPPARGSQPESVEVFVNGIDVGQVPLAAGPVRIDVAGLVAPGKSNEVTIRSAARRPGVEARFRADWYEPWKAATKAEPLALDVSYSVTRASTNQPVRCSVRVERHAAGGYGMMIAEIGLPPGAEVDRGTLSDLLADGRTGVDSFEVAPDHVTLYLWPRANQSNFNFTFRPRYPMRARTAPSALYDYYNPEARVVAAPVVMVVQD